MAIVLKGDFKPSDPFNIYKDRANPLDPKALTPAVDPEAARFAEEQAAAEQFNQQAAQDLEQLEAEKPGQYKLISETELDAWQQDWQAKQPGWLEDTARIMGGAIGKGVGVSISGLGNSITALTNVTTTPIINNIFGTEYGKANPLAVPGDWVSSLGEKAQEGVSFATREAIANSTPDGDLLDPGSWTLGTEPSLVGYGALTLDVFGQMAPIIAASIAAGPAAGAIVGGLQGGGAASQQAEDLIDQMASQPGLLERESAYYREQIAAGKSHEDALLSTKAAAGQAAFILTAPISGLGGYATAKIIDPATVVLAGRNIAARIAGKAGLSALEEGTQEAAESVATNVGINAGAGMDQALTEGTFADFMLGALAGGGTGAIAGAFGGRDDKPVATTEQQFKDAIPVDVVGPDGQPAAEPVAPAAPSGPMTRALQHGLSNAPSPEAGAQFIINDPALPGMGAGPGHGQVATMAPNQAGLDPNMRRVILEDGSERIIGMRLLSPLEGEPTKKDLQNTKTPLATSRTMGGKPDAGSRVTVNMPGLPEFNARIEQYVTGEETAEALVIDDNGEVLQIPVQHLTSLDLTPEQIRADDAKENPPVEREPVPSGPAVRQVDGAALQFPDPTHAELFDLAYQRRQYLRLNRATGEGQLSTDGTRTHIEEYARDEVRKIADELGILPKRVGPMADEYLYWSEKAAKTAASGLPQNLPPVDAKKLAEWRTEREKEDGYARLDAAAADTTPKAIAAPAPEAPSVDDAAWWGALPPGARTALLASAKIKRSPGTSWDKFSRPIKVKLAGLRIEQQAMDRPDTDPLAPDQDAEADAGSIGEPAMEQVIDDGAERQDKWRKDKEQALKDLEDGAGPLSADDEAEIRRLVDALSGDQMFPDEAEDYADRVVEATRQSRLRRADDEFEKSRPAPSSAKSAKAIADKYIAIDTAAAMAATSPTNDLPEPSAAQKEAGNYALGHHRVGGLDLSIENPAGSERKGTDKSGKPWSVTMKSHYGYIKGTVGKDKDHIDVFVKPGTNALANEDTVYVVDQVIDGKLDEHKVMLGFGSIEEAQRAYMENYTKGWQGLGGISGATLAEFRKWAKSGNTSKPFGTLPAPREPDAAPPAATNLQEKRPKTEKQAPAAAPVDKSAPKSDPVAEPVAQPEADAFANNKLFTADKVAAARARLKSKMGQLNSGIDPEVLVDGMTIAGAYIEAGVRDFSGYANAMVEDFGDRIKPYLLSFWEGARNYPGLNNTDMTPADESARLHAALVKVLPAEEAAPLGQEMAKPKKRTRKTGRGGDRTLTDDFGVDHIDGWTSTADGEGIDTDFGMKGGVKDAFLRDASAYLKAVVVELQERGYTPADDAKGRATKPVSVNESGPATSGDVTMTMRDPDTGVAVYVHIGASALRGTVPTTISGASIMFRAGANTDRYATRAGNNWAPIDLSASDFATMLHGAAGRAAGAPLANDKQATILDLKALIARPALTAPEAAADDQARSELDTGNTAGVATTPGGRGRAAQSGSAQADRGDLEADQPDLLAPPAGGGAGSEAGVRAAAENVDGSRRADGERDAGDGRPRNGGAQPSDAGAGSRADARAGTADARAGVKDPKTVSPANKGSGNFHIADPLAIVGGGQVARFEKNKAALELANSLREEGRKATHEEQAIIAGWTGWGSFGQDLFQGTWENPRPKAGWEARDKWLRANVDQVEWQSLQRSIVNAHYTDPPTVTAMWSMAQRMGFAGGRVLEPSMGIGNFFGMMPLALQQRSNLTGIELEQLTGDMAKLLYPDANVSIMGYQDSKTPDDFYDMVIGNWPFADVTMADRRYNRLSPALHDYFFLKAMDQVRPGGLVMGITSKGTMDKKDSTVRTELAKKGELVAAFRLPSGAFEQYAGTSVVTDIIILRKRDKPAGMVSDSGWIKSVPYQTPSGQSVDLNEYYVKNPDHVVGTIDFGQTMYRPGMIVNRPDDMEAQLARITALVPAGAYQPDTTAAKAITYITNHTDDREGALTRGKDGSLQIVRGEHLVAATDVVKYALKDQAKTQARTDQLNALIDMRKAYAELIAAERNPEADPEPARKSLNKLYKAFTGAHGSLTASFGLGYLRKIDDPFYAALAALERTDGDKVKPADILSGSTTRGARKLDNPSVADAFVLARNAAVNPSLEQIAEIAKRSVDQVRTELLTAGAMFELPNGDVTPSDIYLSGNVREKMRQARAALDDGNTAMEHNVKALEKVMPPDVPYFNIEVQFGASWVPTTTYADYVAHMLGADSAAGIAVTYVAGRWRVTLTDDLKNKPEARANFGTQHYSFFKLVNAAISNQTVVIRKEDSDGTSYVDPEATEETNAKIEKIRTEFGQWLWSDPTRRYALEAEYNEVRNAFATPSFDGSFLSFEGMALSLGNGPFDLRQHQVNAIWRALVTRKSLNAHEVGTGKTFTMGGIAVESRRYGIAKKPLLLAHNANSKTVAAEIQQMYPGAKVLYIDNLAPAQIDVKMRQIANDDWDAVVVPHSLISRFSLTEETLMKLAAEEIAALEAEAYAAAADDGVNLESDMLDDEDAMKKVRSPTAKQLVKTRNRIIENIKKQAQRASKEGALSFEDLGIDMLLVDEVHEFKKPPFSTRMRIKGLNTQSSDKAIALAFLTRFVRGQNNDGNVHLFTGTPVTNTLTEVFHAMRYIMAEEMAQTGVDQWDGWFGSFAKEVQDVELNAAAEYEAVTRLAGFINVPELRRMIGQYMDVVFSDDMPEMQPRRTSTGKVLSDKSLTERERAELLNGRTEKAQDRPYKKVINDTADLTPHQDRAFKEIQAYASEWRHMSGKEKKEAMMAGSPQSPIIYEGLAAKASFDVRLTRAEALAGREGTVSDNPNSKASRVVRNVAEIYRSHRMATQVIFTNMGISTDAVRSVGEVGDKSAERYKVFSTVRDIIARLVAEGIPREQIATVDGSTSKDKRKAIADAMNRAEIRVVIGSTGALGVGVNMQKNLRAMHHMDAPWMPGDLEQRNGRGQRQGNQWNTVLEYRYLTDRIDGRRWQVLAIKQRFIQAFLKSDDSTRIIEGDAASDDEGDILTTFSEAAGDPRVLIRAKLLKKIEQLKNRQRLYETGIVDAENSAKRLERANAEDAKELARMEPIAVKVEAVVAATAGDGFTVTIDGKEIDKRGDAREAIDELIDANQWGSGMAPQVIGSFGGYPLHMRWAQFDSTPKIGLMVGGQMIEGKAGTLTALENTLRGYRESINAIGPSIAERERSIERLRASTKEPFHQADEMVRIEADFVALEKDMAANPVPPPAWLRQGAPVDTEVIYKGERHVVTGHRWTDEGWFVLSSGSAAPLSMPYLEVNDAQGMALYDAREFTPPEVIDKVKKPDEPGKPDDSAKPDDTVPEDAEFSASEVNADHPMGWGAVENLPELLTDAEQERLTRMVQQVSGLSAVEWRERIIVDEGNEAWGKDTPMEAAGFYDPSRDVVALTTQWGNPKTALHEAFHRLQWVFLNDQERQMLADHEGELKAMLKGHRPDAQIEQMWLSELEAEAFGLWASGAIDSAPPKGLAGVWRQIKVLLKRSVNYLMGNGWQIPTDLFARAASGEIAARAPRDRYGSGARRAKRSYSMADGVSNAGRVLQGKLTMQNIGEEIGGRLTDLKPSMLAAIPLNYFTELKRPTMIAVDQYLKVKRYMDAYRGKKHADVDTVAQAWRKYAGFGFAGANADGKTKAAQLADLMHQTTLAGVDPSLTDEETAAKAGYVKFREAFLALSPKGQALYRMVRDTYAEQADELDAILLENVQKTQEIAFRRAEDKYREALAENAASSKSKIDKSLAERKIDDTFKGEMARATATMKARMTKLRLVFEASRVPAPYFPLARFGRYYVSVKDIDGNVISFSKRESEADRRRLERDMREAFPTARVESGLLAEGQGPRDMMDPRIVAEIETLLGDAGVDSKVMDMVWQRYLETMPDLSARKRFIHRKGVAGFDGDALRTFAHNQFHAAHQMARLKYGLELQELANQATDQARKSDDPVRGMVLANELKKRHEWVMNPTGSKAVQAVTSTMFVWYLAATPAAAIVNMTQTPMMGIPVLGARLGGLGKATAAIGKASVDLVRGKGTVTRSNLNAGEKRAMEAFYESGMIDRTQAHDLAGVGETGIAYSPWRQKVMGVISWAFHQAEVWNREVTALAAYRMARDMGQHEGKAIDTAHELTWAAHFDYSNSSRARVMQGDTAKLLLVFQSHQVNMWYRLMRDIHQSVKGESPQARKEARYQLAGIMGMMALFSGVTGLFGYNVLIALAGMVFDDDDDPRTFKDEFEGHIVDLFGPDIAGVILKGAPGHLTKLDLTSRIGMADFFIRAPFGGSEGRDWYQDLMVGAMGVVPSTFLSTVDGIEQIKSGNFSRGIETMAPKMIKDLMQAWRYANEGVLNRKGDVTLDRQNIDPWDVIAEAIGFTPAKVAESYERIGALKDAESNVVDERRVLMNRFALAFFNGDDAARDKAIDAIIAWNQKPYAAAMPITSKSLKLSLAARQRNASKRDEGALISDPELSQMLREAMPERMY